MSLMINIFDSIDCANQMTKKSVIVEALWVVLQSPGLALFITYFSMGALAHASGIDLFSNLLSTLTIYALPGQIVFADQWALGASGLNIVLSVGIINLRQVPLVFILVPVLKNEYELEKPKLRSEVHYLIAMHFVAVTSWANFMDRYPSIPIQFRWLYYFVSATSLLGLSMLAVFLGFYLAPEMPKKIYAALLIANPLYFLCILTRTVVFNRKLLLSIALGGLLVIPFSQLTYEWGVLLSGVVGGLIAFSINRFLAGGRKT